MFISSVMEGLETERRVVARAADELGAFFDHLRQVGLRGFVAEHMGDDDFTYRPEDRPRTDS